MRARQQYLKLSEREKREQKGRWRLICQSDSPADKLFDHFKNVDNVKNISPAASLVLWQKRVPFGT